MKVFRLINEEVKQKAAIHIEYMPADGSVEVVIRKWEPKRSNDQNALMWSGPLSDIEKQAFVNGRQFDVNTWHEFFKQEFLPDESQMNFEELARHVKNPESYKKWRILPDGTRVLNGSTTDLTKFGFSQYLEQIFAYGAELGVMFSTVDSK